MIQEKNQLNSKPNTKRGVCDDTVSSLERNPSLLFNYNTQFCYNNRYPSISPATVQHGSTSDGKSPFLIADLFQSLYPRSYGWLFYFPSVCIIGRSQDRCEWSLIFLQSISLFIIFSIKYLRSLLPYMLGTHLIVVQFLIAI